MINRIRCSYCRNLLNFNDFVYLDRMNIVNHQSYYNLKIDTKDQATFVQINETYKLS